MLFQSKFFYGEKCRRTRISSPAECVIGACRSLGVRLAAPECRDHITAMGQELFAPPNVKGWDGERKWVHAGTWAARQAFGQRVGELASGNDFGPNLDAFALVPAEVTDPKKVADLLVERVLEGTLSKKSRAEIAELPRRRRRGAEAGGLPQRRRLPRAERSARRSACCSACRSITPIDREDISCSPDASSSAAAPACRPSPSAAPCRACSPARPTTPRRPTAPTASSSSSNWPAATTG